MNERIKIENMKDWPQGSAYSIFNATFELVTGKKFNREAALKWLDSYRENKPKIGLLANPTVIKALDTQIPTLPTTYRIYLLQSGEIDEIIYDEENVLKDNEAYVLRLEDENDG